MTDNPLHQCNTCRLEGKRSCTYHGYPTSQIPDSCYYKIGLHAEGALKNLTGTHLDVWTKEHDVEILNEFMKAIDYRFNDTEKGRMIIKTIEEIKNLFRVEEEREELQDFPFRSISRGKK